MKLKLNWENPFGNCPRSVALGTFDGVHLGHRQLLRLAVRHKPINGCSTVFTFDYPPEQVFHQKVRLVCDFSQKVRLIKENGIDEVVWVQFDQDFAHTDPDQFVYNLLVRTLQATHIVCGFNFRFGFGGKGDACLLDELSKKYGYTLDVVPPFLMDGDVVSSTRIRQLLENGDIEQAGNLLGRFPYYTGEVVCGANRGRSLGFPTANLKVSPLVLLPKEGVYVTWCVHQKTGLGYSSVTSVGRNLTFESQHQTVETYILDFSGNIYGDTIDLHFLHRLRGMIRFSDPEQLKLQIKEDVLMARRHLAGFRLQGRRVVLE